ncbi:Pycsar system effector family protein [Streptomyces europaeiscabiei]|uniref:Pycsar system effector family protein n=1 Tax=Streptomyces europaeiscabiei TaxID=146819 RepID=UPI002E2D4B99|nr:Pycsar system effector family protein [Streptomyces europaeiscabiei]
MSAGPTQVAVQEVQAGTQLLADLRAEIARADTKASVLAGALGIMAGLLGGHRWSPAVLSPTATILWWAGAASLVTALFALLLAVLPRYRRSTWEPGRPLTYFGDIRRAARVGGLPAAVAETGRDPALGLFLALAETSRIVARKHFWIRTGLVTFGCSAVLLPGSALMT